MREAAKLVFSVKGRTDPGSGANTPSAPAYDLAARGAITIERHHGQSQRYDDFSVVDGGSCWDAKVVHIAGIAE